MPQILKDLKLSLEENLGDWLRREVPGYDSHRVLRKSVDARRAHSPYFVYTVEVALTGEQLAKNRFELEPLENYRGEKPIVVGTGPAGLFAALRLAERGVPCLIFERGSQSSQRIVGINRFWRYGEMDPRNNVCFGEGGAGLYSDGKLITRIKSPHIPYVMSRLVQFGAPAEIEYLSNPHVGSDRIRRLIPVLRERLQQLGCEFHFDTQITELLFSGASVKGVKTQNGQEFLSSHVILATGHSATDMLEHLQEKGVFLEGKSFAVGLRVEHPQALIDQIQYRGAFGHPELGAANYKLTYYEEDSQTGVYSFCMCPGGFILSSGTEATGVVCNGMSNFKRNSPFANAAIVVTVDHEKNFGKDIFGGLKFRRELEERAHQSVRDQGGLKELPAQKLEDFLSGKISPVQKHSSPSGAKPVRLDQVLPPFLTEKLRVGFLDFHKKMSGFVSNQAQVFGVETRTSCPVRITRDPITLESISHQGLYPAGEGAGYAGGITSAACDGIRIAETLVDKLRSKILS